MLASGKGSGWEKGRHDGVTRGQDGFTLRRTGLQEQRGKGTRAALRGSGGPPRALLAV